MASLSMTEDHLQCSICMDIFRDPVTTPCGHNFCKMCIVRYWATRDPVCPLCNETFKVQPELRVNTFISGLAREFIATGNTVMTPDLVAQVKEWKVADEVDGGRMDGWNVEQMVRTRLRGVQETKRSVEISRASCERDVEQVFTDLQRALESRKADVAREVWEKQRAGERQAEGRIQELEQEVADLRGNAGAGLIAIPHQSLSRAGTSTSTSTDLCWKTLGTIVSQLEDIFREEMKKVMDKVLQELMKSAVDVVLDPDTANNFLSVTANGKQAQPMDEWINLPFSPKRFNVSVSVLGTQGFRSGKFYFVVQVSGKTDWGLGVATETANRKGKITPSPAIGYWTLWLVNRLEYHAAEDLAVPLILREKPQKVGVFVDYEEGLVSFYDVEARAHIYSFTGLSFRGERLLPFLSSAIRGADQNAAPLVILPDNHRN